MSLRVAIVMGSASDEPTMRVASETLLGLGIESEMRVLSAHRTPEALREWVQTLEPRGVRIVICGAGGAAHLAGAVAALTTLPVIGVPLAAPNAIARLAFSRRFGARPSAPPKMKTTAGLFSVRQPCRRPAKLLLLVLSPR